LTEHSSTVKHWNMITLWINLKNWKVPCYGYSVPESSVTLCFAYFRSSVTIIATTELFSYISRTLRNSANVVYFVKQR